VINVFVLNVIISALDMFRLKCNWEHVAVQTLESKRRRSYALNRLFVA